MSQPPANGEDQGRLPRNIWILTAGSFFTDISSEMIIHLLPLFLANILGARTVTIGLIEGVAETTASLLKIISGRLSDAIGRRKWLTVSGYAISTLSKPLLLLANSWPVVLAARFGDRVGKGVRTAPRDALLADSIGTEHRGLAFGLHRAGDTAGAAVGLLGAMLVVWLAQGSDELLARTTFQLAVAVSIIPALLAVLVLAAGIREPQIREKAQQALQRSGSLTRPFKRFLVVIVLFTLGNSADAFLILRAQERGLSVLGVLAVLLLFNLVYASLSTPAAALSDRLGRRWVLLTGWGLYALTYLGFALTVATWQIWLFFALYGIYYALSEGTAKAFVADLVSSGQRGTAYGLYSAAVGLAALPASIIAGLLWQGLGGWPGFGPSAPFLFGAALALLASLLLLLLVPEQRRVERPNP